MEEKISSKKPIAESATHRSVVEGVVWFLVIACALIVVLWSLPAFSTGLITCRQSPNMAAATSIESAVISFKYEYGVLPKTAERVWLGGPEGVKLLAILLGKEKDSADRQNSRGIRFLSVRKAVHRKGGLRYSDEGRKIDGVFDSWGNPYVVVLDAKNEGKVQFDYGSRIVDLPGKFVAVYSPGEDGKTGTEDDIKTWGN